MALTEAWFDIPIEYITANKEYKEFIKFIKSAPDLIKRDLSNFLYPFFVYIYMTLLQNGKLTEGQHFVKLFSPLFSSASGYADVVKVLSEFKSIQDFKNHSYFKQFCENKYVINLPEECIVQLRSFFEETESKALLSIFRLHIHVKRKNLQNYSDINLWDLDCAFNYFGSSSESPESELTKFKSVLKVLKESLNKPINYSYKILPGDKNLCVADINFNSTQLACGFENSEIHVWSLTSDFCKIGAVDKESRFAKVVSDELNEFLENDISVEKVSNPSSDKILRGHGGSVFGLSSTPDNTLLVSCSEDGTARAWSLENYKSLAVYSGHNHPIWDVAVSPDSAYFATASNDARMWTYEDHLPLRIFINQSGSFDCITFHPNSKYIATASTDKTIRLWTTEDARDVRSFSGHEAPISSITFAPNGKYLASADDKGLVKIWDLSSGQVLKEFKPHSSRILSMSYNRNGSLLATGGFDNFLKVWDARFPAGEESAGMSDSQNTSSEGVSKLVDSHFINSTLHYVKFCQKDLLVSVSSSKNEISKRR